jgi:hypothetical protein
MSPTKDSNPFFNALKDAKPSFHVIASPDFENVGHKLPINIIKRKHIIENEPSEQELVVVLSDNAAPCRFKY